MASEQRKKLRRAVKSETGESDNPLEMAYQTAKEKWGDGWDLLSYDLKESAVAREALAMISAETVNPDTQPDLFQAKQFAQGVFRIVHVMDGEQDE